MATERDFLEAQAKFNNIYNINFSIKQYQLERKVRKRVEKIKNFTFEINDEKEPIREYVSTLFGALELYLEKKTMIRRGKTYDMSDVSIGNFIEEFDDVMRLKYESEQSKEASSRYVPFGGLKYKRLTNLVWRSLGQFNKPLHEIWANNLVKNDYSIDDMKAITDHAADKLVGATPENIGDRSAHLANIVMAKQAMEKVRAGRGFWWKIWIGNWNRNSEEKQYLNELTATVESYRENGFNIDSYSSVGSVLARAHEKLNESVETFEARQLEKAEKRMQEELSKSVDEYKNTADDIEVWENLSKNPTKAEKLAKEIANNLPDDGASKLDYLVSYIKGNKFKEDIELIKDNLNRDANEGKNISYQMKHAATLLRISMLTVAREMRYTNPLEREVVAQAISNVLMAKLPTVINNPETYGKYANGYMMNEAVSLLDAQFIRPNECDRLTDAKPLYDEYLKELGSKPPVFAIDWKEEKEEIEENKSAPAEESAENEKEVVSFENGEFSEKDTTIVAKIEDDSKKLSTEKVAK